MFVEFFVIILLVFSFSFAAAAAVPVNFILLILVVLVGFLPLLVYFLVLVDIGCCAVAPLLSFC